MLYYITSIWYVAFATDKWNITYFWTNPLSIVSFKTICFKWELYKTSYKILGTDVYTSRFKHIFLLLVLPLVSLYRPTVIKTYIRYTPVLRLLYTKVVINQVWLISHHSIVIMQQLHQTWQKFSFFRGPNYDF